MKKNIKYTLDMENSDKQCEINGTLYIHPYSSPEVADVSVRMEDDKTTNKSENKDATI